MHIFDYEQFQHTFLQNHFSEKAVPKSTSGLDKGCIFQDRKGKKNYSNIWQWRWCLVIFT